MTENDLIVVENLRKFAEKGAGTCAIIEILKNILGPENFNSFAVISYFMKAFNLKLLQVRELPGAEILGGGVYSNQKIDLMIDPLIENYFRAEYLKSN